MFYIFKVFSDLIDDTSQAAEWEVWFCSITIDETANYHTKHKELGVVIYKKGKIKDNDASYTKEDEGNKDGEDECSG